MPAQRGFDMRDCGFKPYQAGESTDQGDLDAAAGWLRPGEQAARDGAADRAGPEEAAMQEHFVWMTTRRIRPGTLTDFERAWRPDTRPEGMLNAYAYWSDDEQQLIGVSFWSSRQSCDAWRASEAEARRREAMAPYIIDEQEAFYRGRELVLPAH